MELAKPQVLQHGTWVLTLPLIGAAWVAFATWRGSLRSAVAAWALTFPLAVTAASLWLLPELDVVKSRKPVGDAVRTLVPTDAE